MSFHRVEGFLSKSSTSVRKLLGYYKTTSMFQMYKENDEEKAEELIANTQKRSLTHTYTLLYMNECARTHTNKLNADSLHCFTGSWRK